MAKCAACGNEMEYNEVPALKKGNVIVLVMGSSEGLPEWTTDLSADDDDEMGKRNLELSAEVEKMKQDGWEEVEVGFECVREWFFV